VVTDTPTPGKPDKFQPLRDAYRRALPQRVGEICDSWASARRSGANAAQWQTLERLLHTLAGSAGTFGCQALGEQARALEDFLRSGANCDYSERTAEIERQLARLRLEAEKP